MLNKRVSERFLKLMNEAQDASKEEHARMRYELAIYNNRDSYIEGTRVANFNPISHESLNPEVQKGIIRMVPAMRMQAQRIEILPDKTRHTTEDAENIEELTQWTQMFQEVHGAGQVLEDAIYDNLIFGHAIQKARWDPEYHVVRIEALSPLSIAVDKDCSRTDLSNAGFLVHETMRNERYIRRMFPNYKIPYQPGNMPDEHGQRKFRVRELWMRRWVAEQLEVDVNENPKGEDISHIQIFYATAIDDHVLRVRSTPFWYPDFPFSTWRNFPIISKTRRQSRSFWGHGYGSLCWSQQKFLDEVYSNMVLLLRRLSIGRVMSRRGALDMEQIFTGYGVNIEIDEDQIVGNDIRNTVMPFPSDTMPEWMFLLFQQAVQGLQGMMPSLQPVFGGEAPTKNASGKLANTLQWATFNQISNNVSEMNEFRLLQMRQIISLTQQFARMPLAAHIWRRGVDFPEQFRESSRFINYRLKMPDATSLPNTPAGKLEVAQILAGMGAMMTIDELIKFVGFDQGYGWDEDTFVQQPVMNPAMTGQGNPLNQPTASDMEAGMI